MVRFPTRVGARVVHGAMRERGCRALRERLYDCVGAEAGRTGARRHPGVRVALLGVRANDASLTRASDGHQPSGNVDVHVRAGAGVGVGADGDAGAGGVADVGGVGVDVGAYGWGDASGCAHGCDHAGVGSLLNFEEVVKAAPLCPEDEDDDGPASVGAGAGADGSGGTDWHACAHTVAVHAGGVHQDQDAMVLVPIEILSFCQRPQSCGKTYLSIRVAHMRGPVIRLAWYRCRNNWVDITQPIALMGFLLSWIPFPLSLPFPLSISFPIPIPISVSVPLALSHPLVIDIPLALMVQFHRRPPALWWRPTSYR